jgi:hypothetical protein
LQHLHAPIEPPMTQNNVDAEMVEQHGPSLTMSAMG